MAAVLALQKELSRPAGEIAGEREEAIRVLDPALAGGAAFPERAEAEKLLAEMRAGR